MDKYKKYYGVMIFVAAIAAVAALAYFIVNPQYQNLNDTKTKVEDATQRNAKLKQDCETIRLKIKERKAIAQRLQKRIYTPIESDLGNDTLFFTMYNDVIEMLHSNSIKIRTIDYAYNPKEDNFVVSGGPDRYFVCDVNMELVSNYVNLGKLIQDIYQYPYYIKINELEVKPYPKDKKILISTLKLRLYARTEPEVIQEDNSDEQPPITE